MGLAFLRCEDDMEFLTVEEFAERMKISRSTAYSWIAANILASGTDVMRVGGILRVVWSENLVGRLLQLTVQADEKASHPPLRRKVLGGGNRRAFDPSALDIS